MARAYSGVLGAIALCLAILRGIMLGMLSDEILIQGLVVFFCFACLGFWIGSIAESTVCESVENRFRDEMASLKSAATDSETQSTEQ